MVATGESLLYPWLTLDEELKLNQQVDAMNLDDFSKKVKARELYTAAKNYKDTQKKIEERDKVKVDWQLNWTMSASDVRASDVADNIRILRAKQWYVTKENDNELIAKFIKYNTGMWDAITSYINSWWDFNKIFPKELQNWQTLWGWVWAAIGWWTLATLPVYWVWKAVEWAWKKIYEQWIKAVWETKWLQQEWAAKATYKAFGWEKPKTIVETAMESKWIWWWPIQIAAAAKKNFANMWNNKIQPVMNAIDEKWFIKTADELIWEIGNYIDKIPQITNKQWYAQKLKWAVEEYFLNKIDEWIGQWNLNQLQGEKELLRDTLTKKVTEWIYSEKFAQEAEKVISDTFSDIIHTTLKSVWKAGKTASKAFKDYSNLKKIEEASKLYSNSLLKWWIPWAMGAALKWVWVPLSTMGGKAIMWVWKALQWTSPVKWIEAAAKSKILPNLVKKWFTGLAWLVKASPKILKWAITDPLAAPFLLQSVPWSIWEWAKQAIETIPIYRALNEINPTLEWLFMSEKQKFQAIKDAYKQEYDYDITDQQIKRMKEEKVWFNPDTNEWLPLWFTIQA